jgi:hypothetical protein
MDHGMIFLYLRACIEATHLDTGILTVYVYGLLFHRFSLWGAKLRKKLVTNEGFLEILCKQSVLLGRANAIRPKTKIKRKRMGKYENEGNAKLGGLVKELGFLFVTQILVSEGG